LVSSRGILAFVDRLIAAIERCDPDAVFSVQHQPQHPSQSQPQHPSQPQPLDPAKQVEVCIELLCKFLPPFISIDRPDWMERYLGQLTELQADKDRIKPRSRFMLFDFFKEIRGIPPRKN
jgi:hypothetical protein